MANAVEAGLRERKKLTTRQALSHAALRLALERGPANVRREDIASAANVSLRTFNNYFSSKEDAIVALFADRAAAVSAGLRARPAREPLRKALVAAFAEQYPEAPGREWIAQIRVILSADHVRGAYLAALTDAETSLASAIAERLGTDGHQDLRPRVLAAAARSAERVAVSYWLDGGGQGQLSEVVRHAVSQVVR